MGRRAPLRHAEGAAQESDAPASRRAADGGGARSREPGSAQRAGGVDDGHQAGIVRSRAAETSEAPCRQTAKRGPGTQDVGASRQAVQTSHWRERRKREEARKRGWRPSEDAAAGCNPSKEQEPEVCAVATALLNEASSARTPDVFRPERPPCAFQMRHCAKPFSTSATFRALAVIYWTATSTFTSAGDDCFPSGPAQFQVTCSKGGLYLDSAGKSAYKRCSPLPCPKFEAPANSVLFPLLGADPSNLRIGDQVEFKCNSGYTYRGQPDETNRTECKRDPHCSQGRGFLQPHWQCIFDTYCPVKIDANGFATARWWIEENQTEMVETRNSASHPLRSFIFNRESVTTHCNAGYRSSLAYPAQSPWSDDGICALKHTMMCTGSGQLDINASCIPITCPPFNTTCNDVKFCGSDLGQEIATVTPNTTLIFGQSATIRCNAGYYLPVSSSFAPDCSAVLSAGALTTDYTSSWNAICSSQCNYNAPPRSCEPLPCPCVQVPGNATPSIPVSGMLFT